MKSNNKLSKNIYIDQGVRKERYYQLCFRKDNTILQAIEKLGIGANIGNINVMAPTCADDI